MCPHGGGRVHSRRWWVCPRGGSGCVLMVLTEVGCVLIEVVGVSLLIEKFPLIGKFSCSVVMLGDAASILHF